MKSNAREQHSKASNSVGHTVSGFGSLGHANLRWSEGEIPMALHYSKTALSVIVCTTGELSRLVLPEKLNGENCICCKDHQYAERLEKGLERIHRASSRLHRVFEGLLLDEMPYGESVCCIEPDSDLRQKVSFYQGVRDAKIKYVTEMSNSVSEPHRIELPVSRMQWEFMTDTLFGNAISYCGGEPPDITIGWGLDRDHMGRWFRFRVRDRGTGIHKEDLHQIKKPFYRGRNAGYTPGSGAGLYLTARMLRRCGGQIEIESEVDRFTEVKISIPVR